MQKINQDGIKETNKKLLLPVESQQTAINFHIVMFPWKTATPGQTIHEPA
jgi:hypothetical protein